MYSYKCNTQSSPMTYINNERHYQTELDTVYSKSNPIMVERQNRSADFKRLGYQKKGNETIIANTNTDNKHNEQISKHHQHNHKHHEHISILGRSKLCIPSTKLPGLAT